MIIIIFLFTTFIISKKYHLFVISFYIPNILCKQSLAYSWGFYLEPIPKFDRIITFFPLLLNYDLHPKKEKKKINITILKIPDELWDRIKSIFPKEKPFKTVGRPIVRYRKVMDGILYILRAYPKIR